MNEANFFAAIRETLFGGRLGQPQVNGIKGILSAFDAVGDRDQDTLAYSLATAFHETGARMLPVREGFAKSDAGARKAVAALARKRGPKSAVARYSQPAGPHGHVYYGRGHVQLTWLENYARSSADAGVDLVANPDAMLDPVISARVLVRGVIDGRWNGRGHGLDHYEGEDDHLDTAEAAEARRTVNVQDKAKLIAGYHLRFYGALTKAGWKPAVDAPKPTTKPVVDRIAPDPVHKPSAPPAAYVAAVAAAAAAAWQWGADLVDFLTFWN